MSDDVKQLDARLMLRGLGWDVGLPLAGYLIGWTIWYVRRKTASAETAGQAAASAEPE
jgi:hypothetical protein